MSLGSMAGAVSPSYIPRSNSSLSPDHSNEKQQASRPEPTASSLSPAMAPSFGRSISFPLSPARASRPRAAAYHVRSVSLPCTSHPLLAHLCNHIAAVRSWVADPISASTGLAHLDALHAALAELFLLPEVRSALHHGSATPACLLDGFLVLADAHGAFQETVVELRAHTADAQVALRRRDDNRLASAVRSLRRAEKDLARLASSVRSVTKFPTLLSVSDSVEEVEVSGALAEAVAAAACASAAVFSAVETVSSAATTKKTMASSLKSLVKSSKASSDEEKEVAALERLDEVEACVAEIEGASDKLFRSILHTRVALLNIQTHTCC
ncbi:uncharacterized protein LOC124684628 [Lolium rigidum]|uniref:uncharacterized protein LOC124684628 n=1 Tax=Lolium rigidum TaxID=89674 RepID=UPI001F5C4E06|nr:uncharacterized protein LOC124684628 [Lolium rigidum]